MPYVTKDQIKQLPTKRDNRPHASLYASCSRGVPAATLCPRSAAKWQSTAAKARSTCVQSKLIRLFCMKITLVADLF